MEHKSIIKAVKYWLDKTIIGFNFCPFAKREFVNNTIHYQVTDESKFEGQLMALFIEFERLENEPDIATTLMIFPVGLESFYTYLDFLELANDLLFDSGFEGVYQLASFHPDYCFEDLKSKDVGNYTNRSPYPIIHIIREESLERALKQYPDPENIPVRNIALAHQKGSQVFEQILKISHNNHMQDNEYH